MNQGVKNLLWGLVFGLLAILLLGADDAHSATYYIDAAAGNDARPGTESEPFKTIQKGADVAAAGDTIYVLTGTYAPFTVARGGTESEGYVTFSAAPGHERLAVIDGTGSSLNSGSCVKTAGNNYVAIRNFKIRNCNKAGIWLEGGTARIRGLQASGNHISYTASMAIAAVGRIFSKDIVIPGEEDLLSDVIIEDNEITKTNEPSGVNESISVGNGLQDFIIRKNHIHDTQQYGIDMKDGTRRGDVYGNHIERVEKHAIYIDTAGYYARDIEIHHNRMHDNRNGITLARENGNPADIERIYIHDNLAYDNEKFGIQIYMHKDDTGEGRIDDVHIFNNTVVRNGITGIRLTPEIAPYLTNIFVMNNIAFQNGEDFLNGTGDTAESKTNLFGLDPMFVDLAGKDFRLSPESQAIDAGTTLLMADADFAGVPRPQGAGYDIGAFEAGGSPPTPPPPPPPDPTPDPDPTPLPESSDWEKWLEALRALSPKQALLITIVPGETSLQMHQYQEIEK